MQTDLPETAQRYIEKLERRGAELLSHNRRLQAKIDEMQKVRPQLSKQRFAADLQAVAELARIIELCGEQPDLEIRMAIECVFALTTALLSGQIETYAAHSRLIMNAVILPNMMFPPPKGGEANTYDPVIRSILDSLSQLDKE